MRTPTKSDIEAAHERITPFIKRTEVRTSEYLDELTCGQLFFKCENFQHVKAFKFRGATNAVLSLSEDDIDNGVCTHSSGNHAQALALAAKNRGIPAYIVMPNTSPHVKIEGVKSHGAEITFSEQTEESRKSTLAEVQKRTGAAFIHSADNPFVIAGAATAAKELFEEIPGLDMIIAPVGGGGLLSGTSLSARFFGKGIKTWGAEPEMADDAYRSLQAGYIIPSINPQTICDGLLTSLSELTFLIIVQNAEGIVTASEEGIKKGMELTREHLDMMIEPSAAVPLASILESCLDVEGKRVGVIVSGGNLDV